MKSRILKTTSLAQAAAFLNTRPYVENRNVIRLSFLVCCALHLLLFPGCGLQISGDAEVEKAFLLYEQRQFTEAITHLEKALDRNLIAYKQSDVLTTIGNCYNELEQFDKSLEFHQRAIDLDPKNHQAYVNQGVVYRLMGDFDAAGKSYAKALELEPNYAELHASTGALALFQDDFETAIKHLKRAIELDDSLAVAHSNLAIVYATVGRFDEADAQLKKAIIRGYHQPEVIQERIDELRTVAETKN